MTKNESTELLQRLDDLEEKIDRINTLIETYMEEQAWFTSEAAGAIITLKCLYEKKSRS